MSHCSSRRTRGTSVAGHARLRTVSCRPRRASLRCAHAQRRGNSHQRVRVGAIDSARVDFDQRPICGIAQHSVYGEQAAAASPRRTPRRISQDAAAGGRDRCAVAAIADARAAAVPPARREPP
jgi:hypothetical protein